MDADQADQLSIADVTDRRSMSLHLVDPELRDVLQLLPGVAHTPETLPAIREQFRQMVAAAPAIANAKVVEREITVPGPAGSDGVRLWILEPADAPGPRPLLYHVHGGGYTIGFPEMMRGSFTPLVADLGITAISVDYRLAPEHPHPAPVEDSYAGLVWAHAHAGELGIDPNRIALAGESAGGGLAAALALMARDRGEVPIRFLKLGSPMLDDRTGLSDENRFVGEFVWTRAQNRVGWESLLGHPIGRDDVSPYAVPARATDLSGMPPTFIDVGALDLFFEESLDFARRLSRAGVPVELHVYPGTHHGSGMNPAAKVMVQQRQLNEAALRRALLG